MCLFLDKLVGLVFDHIIHGGDTVYKQTESLYLHLLFITPHESDVHSFIPLPPSMSSVQFLELLAGEEGEW